MLRLSVLSALAVATAAQASVISTSVFPNSACAGASTSLGGLVGIGKVTLSNGEVESHCGCPSDNLPSFQVCPSGDAGESVCNSVLDLDTGAFTASCGVVACQGSECPSTVVNTVVVDEADCSANGKGSIGISTVDGEIKCGCSADSGEFAACPTPENGRASCVAVDNDFLGMAYSHKETVECGVICDDGYVLTAANTCAPTLAKRFHDDYRSATTKSGHSTKTHSVVPGHSTTPHVPGHTTRPHGPSHTTGPHFPGHSTRPHGPGHNTKPHVPGHSTIPHIPHVPGHSTRPHVPGHSTRPHVPGHSTRPHVPGHSTRPHVPGHSTRPHVPGHSTRPHVPGHSTRPHVPGHSTRPHVPGHSTRPHFPGHSTRPHRPSHATTKPHGPSETTTKPHGPSETTTTKPHGPATTTHRTRPHGTRTTTHVGPSQSARAGRHHARSVDEQSEIVFGESVCAQDERSCPAGDFGDFSCVRLDDVTECGGCHSTKDAVSCLDMPGVASAMCLRGGCVVRACQSGFVQTSEGTCEARA